MPRAFLIKKKRLEDQAVAATGEIGKDLPQLQQHKSAEDKENLGEDRICLQDVLKKETTGWKEERRAEAVKRQESEEEDRDKERTELSGLFSEKTQSSSATAGTRTSPFSQSKSPLPTDLSVSESSSPVYNPHHASQISSLAPSCPPSSHTYSVASSETKPEVSKEICSDLRHASPPPARPCKRPSDFSTAFLLSHQPATKRVFSPKSVYPYQCYATPASSVEDSHRREKKSVDIRSTQAHAPLIPSPSKYELPGLSVSTWLENQPTSSVLASAYQMCRNREDRISTSSSVDLPSPCSDGGRCFASPSTLHREDVPSAFRRNDSKLSKDFSPRKRDSKMATAATSPLLTVSPRRDETSPRQKRILSTSPRDSVFAYPHDLLTSRLFPPKNLSLNGLVDMRRGTSTSPAHSERTSSGCGSPSDSPDGSPDQPSRCPGELSWGTGADPSSPFLSHFLSVQAQHHLLPSGLRYLPGLPLPADTKCLPDIALPLGYPKSLQGGLASAFKSTRRPFFHPATAAYYSSVRGSLPYSIAFPSLSSADAGNESPTDEIDHHQYGMDRLEMLHVLRKSTFDPLILQHPPSTLSMPSPRIVAAGDPVISSGPSPSSPPASVIESSAGHCPKLTNLPRRLSAVTGLGGSGPAMMGEESRGLRGRGKEHEPVRYQCEACSKSYSTFSGLSKHKQFHCSAQVKKEFSCKYCEKTYVSLGALKMHIRTHTLPCKCGVCGKAFSRPWLLQGHLRTHTGEKPFSCPHCARAFADRSNLRAHLQTHSDVKKYSCRHCSKTFSRMSLLLKHEDGCCNSLV